MHENNHSYIAKDNLTNDLISANSQYLMRRHRKLLLNDNAIYFLSQLGILEKTTCEFKLGLSEKVIPNKNGLIRENALLAPIIKKCGKFSKKTIYLNLNGTTQNPLRQDQWTKGEAQTYYSQAVNSQTNLIVCYSIFDLWLSWQNLQKFSKEKDKILFIFSSKLNEFPSEWTNKFFWKTFNKVFAAFPFNDDGDKKFADLTKFTNFDFVRVSIPTNFGETLEDFWRNGGDVSIFQEILEVSHSNFLQSQNQTDTTEILNLSNRSSFQSFDVSTGLFNGHLYYPVTTLVQKPETRRDSFGNFFQLNTSRKEIVLVKSDRTIQYISEDPAPFFTPIRDRITRLTDGTIIESAPLTTRFSTWGWESITEYIEGRTKIRLFKVIINELFTILKKYLRLPFEYDYALLAYLIPITYAQALFDAVPLILVTGLPGSGKSSLAQVMHALCANSVLIGQSTVASASRDMHDSRGLIILDDVESISTNKSGNIKTNDFIQSLKVSYKKDTAWRQITDTRNGAVTQKLNLFGVKILNNTSGSDAILASRMLTIHTKSIPLTKEKANFNSRLDFSELRNELHTYVFENHQVILKSYQKFQSQINDRFSEIIAPLLVFSEITNDTKLSKILTEALNAKKNILISTFDPLKLLESAVQNLISKNITEISATQVTNEMKQLISHNEQMFASINKHSHEWLQPVWVGKHLRKLGIIDPDSERRKFINGHHLRIFSLSESYLQKIKTSNKSLL